MASGQVGRWAGCSVGRSGLGYVLRPLLSTPGVECTFSAAAADFEWLSCLLIASSVVPKCFLEMAGLGEVSLFLPHMAAQDQCRTPFSPVRDALYLPLGLCTPKAVEARSASGFLGVPSTWLPSPTCSWSLVFWGPRDPWVLNTEFGSLLHRSLHSGAASGFLLCFQWEVESQKGEPEPWLAPAPPFQVSLDPFLTSRGLLSSSVNWGR